MRGFARRVTVEDALAWVDEHASLLGSESIPLLAAAGRVLAEEVISTVQVPPFARSMMDGFALHAAATDGASSYNLLPLTIVGEALPGRPFVGEVQVGQAVKIMTGAPLPSGADAVLPVEKTEVVGNTVFALDSVPPQKNVGRPGEDIEIGASLLSPGRRLRPQDIGLLASIGRGEVNVVRQPRVRIVITGNELLPAGSEPSGCRIVDSNGPMLTALIERDGGIVLNPGIVPDDPQQIAAALQDDVDVVLVSGGSSVGQEDHAPRLLAELGELAIHGIAMRPSSPAGMGRIGQKLVFLLPGNPVSCLCAYDFFAGRAIRRLGGRPTDWPYRMVRLPLLRKLVSQVGRVDYARVRIVDGQVEPVAISGASLLSSTVQADGFVILPGDSEGYPPGVEVEVFLYDL
jgi:molybdopterin molybdotransferase